MIFKIKASIAAVFLFILTGCSSSPSLEDQAKLVEYERCFEFYERKIDRAVEIELGYRESYERLVNLQNFEANNRRSDFSQIQENCAEYRP